MMLPLYMMLLVSSTCATFVPRINVVATPTLIHRHAKQIDGSQIDRTTTYALLAQMVGGKDTTNAPIKTSLPTRDLLKRPNVVLTVVVEGEYSLVDAKQLSGDVAVDYLLSDLHLPAVDLEVISLASSGEASYSIIASDHKRQEINTDSTTLQLESNTAKVVELRGADVEVVARLAKHIDGATILSNTILRVPILQKYTKSSYIALDIGRVLDRSFLYELDLLMSQAPALADQLCIGTASSTVVTSVTTLSALSASQHWNSATSSSLATTITKAIINAWTNACQTEQEVDIVSIIISGVSPANVFYGNDGNTTAAASSSSSHGGRKLLMKKNKNGQTSTIAAKPKLPAGTRYFTQSEINTYQIRVGGGFIFGIALLLAVCLFCGSTMDYTNDPLLFGQISFKKDHLS